MKKIIAFLSVLVMTVAMFATVSFAADNEVVLDYTVDGTTVTIEVSMNTTYTDITAAQIYFDMTEAYNQGATVATTAGKAGMSTVAPQKMVAVAFKPTDGSMYISGDVLGTITITGVSENFAIALKPTSSRTTTKITSVANGEVTADFGTIGADIVVKSAPVVTTATKTYVTTVTDAAGCDEIVYTFTTDYAAAPVKEATETVAITEIQNAAAVTFGLVVENVVTAVDEVPVSFTVDAVVQ